mmetsp:Transcript_5853/g.20518  ORF Transcript_5853/g.20518 Transcript_5853/m.20518 type:complete len:215 (-) Transcript_5853:394-1038(-)
MKDTRRWMLTLGCSTTEGKALSYKTPWMQLLRPSSWNGTLRIPMLPSRSGGQRSWLRKPEKQAKRMSHHHGEIWPRMISNAKAACSSCRMKFCPQASKHARLLRRTSQPDNAHLEPGISACVKRAFFCYRALGCALHVGLDPKKIPISTRTSAFTPCNSASGCDSEACVREWLDFAALCHEIDVRLPANIDVVHGCSNFPPLKSDVLLLHVNQE